MPHKITNNYSPNFSLPKRTRSDVKFIIIHYTGMKKEILAIKKLCDQKSKVSAHYFIKKNGEIWNLVPDMYIAWHAGKSSWKKCKSLNKYSIGIEIQNSGHDHGYENYSLKQIVSLKKLLKSLIEVYKINYKNILGHSDISPDRKKDPGEKFPWKHLSKVKIGFWHNLNEIKLKKLRLIKLTLKEKKECLKKLNELGYTKIKNLKHDQNNKIIAKAFQRRFRQSLVNGILDQECLLKRKNLLKS